MVVPCPDGDNAAFPGKRPEAGAFPFPRRRLPASMRGLLTGDLEGRSQEDLATRTLRENIAVWIGREIAALLLGEHPGLDSATQPSGIDHPAYRRSRLPIRSAPSSPRSGKSPWFAGPPVSATLGPGCRHPESTGPVGTWGVTDTR